MPEESLSEAGLGEKVFFKERMVCHLSLAEPDVSDRSLLARSTALSFFADFFLWLFEGA